MTDTTTTEQTDHVHIAPDVDRSAEVAVPESTALSAADVQERITAIEQRQFEEFELAVRRMLGLEDASEGEIRLFQHVCHKSGLDPFNKEVYMIGRNTEVGKYEPVDAAAPDGPKRKVMRWVTKYTIQTSIHGFRKRAREIAEAKGIDLEFSEPLWCGDDAVWKEVWPEKKPPTASKFVVFRNGKPYTFIAHYDEFVQTSGAEKTPNSMWSKMPRNQLRKCAEANAIQAAFPDELAGLLLEDAVQSDIIDGTVIPAPVQRPAQRGRGVSALREAAAAAQEQSAGPGHGDGNDVGDGAESSSGAPFPGPPRDQHGLSKTARKKWQDRMFQLFGAAGVDSREDQLLIMAAITEKPAPEHRDHLADDDLKKVVNKLNAWDKTGKTDAEIAEILNAATLQQENQENQS